MSAQQEGQPTTVAQFVEALRSHQADDIDALSKINDELKRQADDLQGLASTMDHISNTLDTIIIPTQQSHSDKLTAHADLTKESHDYITSMSGAWSLVQKAGIVMAAIASVATLFMKIMEQSR